MIQQYSLVLPSVFIVLLCTICRGKTYKNKRPTIFGWINNSFYSSMSGNNIFFRFDPSIKFTLCWDVASTEMMVLFFSLDSKKFYRTKVFNCFPYLWKEEGVTEQNSGTCSQLAGKNILLWAQREFIYITLISKCCFCFYSLLLM